MCNTDYEKSITGLYFSSFKNIDESINHFEKKKKDFETPMIKINTELRSGAVDLDVLSSLTTGLQHTFTSAVNNCYGNGSNVGQISMMIKNLSKLAISEVEAGSFVIKLATIDQVSNEPVQLDMELGEKEKLDLLEELVNRINVVEETGFNYLFEEFGLRTVKSSQKWFEAMSKNKVNFNYKKRNSNDVYKFTNDKVSSIYKVLSEIDTVEEIDEVEIAGRLVGYNLNQSKISIESEEEEFNIRVMDDSLSNYEIVVNSDYILNVRRRTISDNFERIDYEYFLDSIDGTSLV